MKKKLKRVKCSFYLAFGPFLKENPKHEDHYGGFFNS